MNKALLRPQNSKFKEIYIIKDDLIISQFNKIYLIVHSNSGMLRFIPIETVVKNYVIPYEKEYQHIMCIAFIRGYSPYSLNNAQFYSSKND